MVKGRVDGEDVWEEKEEDVFKEEEMLVEEMLISILVKKKLQWCRRYEEEISSKSELLLHSD